MTLSHRSQGALVLTVLRKSKGDLPRGGLNLGIFGVGLAFLAAAMQAENMRGYFAIGVEGISKETNLGNLFRAANAFGASFVFTIGAANGLNKVKSDTSDAQRNLPFYHYGHASELTLPKGCALVGVEIIEQAVGLPSFGHPRCAAYVLGPERGNLSPDLVDRCDYLVRIPSRFCLNVVIAGTVVMYDRIASLGRFAPRPLGPGGPSEAPSKHVFGPPKRRRKATLPDDQVNDG